MRKGKTVMVIALMITIMASLSWYLASHMAARSVSFAEQEVRGMGSLPHEVAGEKNIDREMIGALPVMVDSNKNGGGEKTVYLTFDDGPNNSVTPKVLNILETYQVKATFFVIGSAVNDNPEMLIEIAKKGHALGNHTYSHRYEALYGSEAKFLADLQRNEEVIAKLTGTRPVIYRDPGGGIKNNLKYQQFLSIRGYKRAGWNIESYDSRNPRHSSERIVGDIVKQVEARPDLWNELIIIMHDSPSHENTVAALPQVIEYLKNKGFRFEVMQ